MTTDPRDPRVDFLIKRYNQSQKIHKRKYWDWMEDLDKNVALTAARESLKPKEVIVKRQEAKEAKEARQIPPSEVNPDFPQPPGYGEARGWSTEPILVEGEWWRYMLRPQPRKRKSGVGYYVLTWERKRHWQCKEYLECYTYPGFNKDNPPPEVLVYLRGGGQGYTLNHKKYT